MNRETPINRSWMARHGLCELCGQLDGHLAACPAYKAQEGVVQRYMAIGLAVMSGAKHIATAVTNSTAKRIALALNLYVAGQKGK